MFHLSKIRYINYYIETTPKLLSYRRKHIIDRSKVPEINESDLEEKFVRGSGPGGQAVNKNNNCVVLLHKPTGIVVKIHESRCQDTNRKLAREKLVTKLDNIFNGTDSVEQQMKRVEKEKSLKSNAKRKKIADMKFQWKNDNKKNLG